jgi:hypothetical protein
MQIISFYRRASQPNQRPLCLLQRNRATRRRLILPFPRLRQSTHRQPAREQAEHPSRQKPSHPSSPLESVSTLFLDQQSRKIGQTLHVKPQNPENRDPETHKQPKIKDLQAKK